MALNPRQDLMNRALDERLTASEQAELQAHLDANPREGALYDNLRAVDAFFQAAPMIVAPPGFAMQVMARIEAGEHEALREERRALSRLALWLGLSALVVLPLLGLVLVLVVQAATQPAALAGALQGLIQTLGSLGHALENVMGFLSDLVDGTPLVPLLLVTVIPLLMLWGWLVWYVQRINRPPTVTVKVHVVGSD
ncbi:MAG: hypothetical protein JW910_11210 [Anaerolineae bacterium]|nr:hypothetical protein [Anaerolineae bacterium]